MQPILVLAANGKTGRRVADRLEQRGVVVRRASRSSPTPFDWNDPTTWEAALQGVRAAYIAYTPDLAVPESVAAIERLTDLVVRSGVGKLVLLSGRGEQAAQRCEQIVLDSGIDSTVVRASWFNQNFSEGPFFELILHGHVSLPVDSVREPFVDADDIADVAVSALTEDGHAGEVYEVTGPRLMTFAEAVASIAEAAGRDIKYEPVTVDRFVQDLHGASLPPEYIDLLVYLFTEVLDGRNARLADGVQRALGRSPRDLNAYAHDTAATGVWNAPLIA